MGDAVVIGALGGKLAKLDGKLDAIFASLQRRTTETWNDDLEFALWVLTNCTNYNNGIIMGEFIDKLNSYTVNTFQSITLYSAGCEITVNENITLTGIRINSTNTNHTRLKILRKSDLQELYTFDLTTDVIHNFSLDLPPDTYYLDIACKSGTNSSVYRGSVTFPEVNENFVINGGYIRTGTSYGSISLSTTNLYTVDQIEFNTVYSEGIINATAESPLIDSTGLFNYDLIDYLIEANDGSYQVDILDSGGVVIPGYSDVQAREYLTTLDVQDIKVKVTLNRTLDTDESPEVKAVAVSYIE